MKTSGRIICDELKKVRLELAKANGINYQPTVCNHQGECAGTCPACEAELAELTRLINEKKNAKIIGVAPLKRATVAAATALSMSSCVPFMGMDIQGEIEATPIVDSSSVDDDTEYEVMGDVAVFPEDSFPDLNK